MTAALRTRQPTGLVPYPLVLLAGAEKSGKSYSAFALASSPKVGRTFVFDLGEGGADEYAELGSYEIVEHNGTYGDIVEQLEAAIAIPPHEGRPNVIILDSVTNLWQLCKDDIIKIAEARAKKNPAKSSEPTMDLWNRAKDRWRRVIDALMSYAGIAVVTARAGDVTEVEGGKPTGRVVWKVQAEKMLPYDANVIVRTVGPGRAEIVGVRSLKLRMPESNVLPVPGYTLEKVIFDLLQAGGGVRDLRTLSSDAMSSAEAKTRLVEAYRAAGFDQAQAVEAAKAAWGARVASEIPTAEFDQLLAAVPSGVGEATVAEVAQAAAEPLADVPAEGEPSLITTRQAGRLHTLAKDLDPTVLDVLIFNATKVADSASAVTTDVYEALCKEVALIAASGVLPPGYDAMCEAWAVWREQLDQRAGDEADEQQQQLESV